MTLPACGTRKGVIGRVRLIKTKGDGPSLVECVQCGARWPLKAGVRHP
jgi:uncharacterized Zn finger protein